MTPPIRPIEAMIEIPAVLKVFKNLHTGDITIEVHADGSMLTDLNGSQLGAGWKEFFEDEVNSHMVTGDLTNLRVAEDLDHVGPCGHTLHEAQCTMACVDDDGCSSPECDSKRAWKEDEF